MDGVMNGINGVQITGLRMNDLGMKVTGLLSG